MGPEESPLSAPGELTTDGPLATLVDSPGQRHARPPFRLPILGRVGRAFVERHRSVAVIGSVASVLILLIGGLPITSPTGASHVSTDALPGPSPAPPTYYPYLESPAAYPSPEVLPNESGPVSLTQLSTQIIGPVPVYDLAFATTIPGVGNVLETQTGAYNASLAQGIFTTGFCASRCSHHLPIL